MCTENSRNIASLNVFVFLRSDASSFASNDFNKERCPDVFVESKLFSRFFTDELIFSYFHHWHRTKSLSKDNKVIRT